MAARLALRVLSFTLLVAMLVWSSTGAAEAQSATPCPINATYLRSVAISGAIGDLVIDSACEYAYATNTDHNRVEVFAVRTGALLTPIGVGSRPAGLDLTPDGHFLYVANSGGNNISVVDVAQKRETRKISVSTGFSNDRPYSIAIASNGIALFSTTFNGSGFGARLMQLVIATDAIAQRTDFWLGGTTTEVTKIEASEDRSVLAIVAGDISSGPVFRYVAAGNSFSPEKDLNTFVSTVSLDRSGTTLLVGPGGYVLDAGLSLSGTITGGGWTVGGAVSPDGTTGYRAVDRTVQVLDLGAFGVTGAKSIPDSTSNGGSGRMELSADGTLLGVITDHGLCFLRVGASVQLVTPATTLQFGVVRSSGVVRSVTPPQPVVVTQTGAGSISWTATPSVPWLSVSPSSGTGPATLTIGITAAAGSLVPGTASGRVSLATNGTANPSPIQVRLAVKTPSTVAAPVGVVDTPIDGQTGVSGSIAVTGWAVDDVGVSGVRIVRDPVGGEGPGAVFLGHAFLLEGARPDVAAAYPTLPLSSRAGWGFLVLTNMLPGQGNGTYVLRAYADDLDGHATLLGTRTITCDNAHATVPFGAIDTPTQGGVAAGAGYVNFGWALAGQPADSGRYIPYDGHTITVYLDSAPLGPLDSYNNPRADIQSTFPGYANTDGAIGLRVIDTTALANGLHTLSWTVVDDAGHTQSIGSRFFQVSNGAGASAATTGRAPAATLARVADGPARAAAVVDARVAPIAIRRGWTESAEPEMIDPGQAGRYTATVVAGERIVIDLNPSRDRVRVSGGRLVAGRQQPLPMGSTLTADGTFVWAPFVGFAGVHELCFRIEQAGATSEVRVRLAVRPPVTGRRAR